MIDKLEKASKYICEVMTQPENKRIADEIAAQIGNKAFYMLGTKNLIVIENGLGIRFTGSRISNYIKITLNGLDLYDVEFMYIRGDKIKTIHSAKDVYFDQLHEIIEEYTGLYLSL